MDCRSYLDSSRRAGLILKDTKSSTSNKWAEPEDSTPRMDADEDETETSSNESKQEVD